MREIARIVSFNGVKIDTMCDFSVLTSMPARISGISVGDIPYFEGGRFPMPGVKVTRGEKVDLVRECVVVLLGGMREMAPVTHIGVNTVDGSSLRKENANGNTYV